MGWLESILVMVGALSCVFLFVQDVRWRSVHVLPLFALGVSGLLFRGFKLGVSGLFEFMLTMGLVFVILALTWIVMRIRKPNVQFVDSQLGLGDIAFFVSSACWLDPRGFMVFFVSGLLLILAGVFVLNAVARWFEDSTIPLAGLLGCYLLFFWPAYQYIQA